jgi:hypothetical protein
MCSIQLRASELIARLKRDIEQLTLEQTEALKSATYIGMTPEEARRHDQRRDKITRLTQQLRQLQQAQ